MKVTRSLWAAIQAFDFVKQASVGKNCWDSKSQKTWAFILDFMLASYIIEAVPLFS